VPAAKLAIRALNLECSKQCPTLQYGPVETHAGAIQQSIAGAVVIPVGDRQDDKVGFLAAPAFHVCFAVISYSPEGGPLGSPV